LQITAKRDLRRNPGATGWATSGVWHGWLPLPPRAGPRAHRRGQALLFPGPYT